MRMAASVASAPVVSMKQASRLGGVISTMRLASVTRSGVGKS